MQLRATGLTWHEAGEDIVALDIEQSVYLKLTGSGRVLWEQLTQPRTEDDLAEALVDEYGIDQCRARQDVSDFIQDLRRRRLLSE
jgi:hypothetical protein